MTFVKRPFGSQMVNERLRPSTDQASLRVESSGCRQTGVDPKVVERWTSGCTSHSRHRWAVTKWLDEREESLRDHLIVTQSPSLTRLGCTVNSPSASVFRHVKQA